MVGRPRGDVAVVERKVALMPSEWEAVDRARESMGLSRSQFARIAFERVGVAVDVDPPSGLPSRRRRTPWTKRAIAEALARFQQDGLVAKFTPPSSGNQRWTVWMSDDEEPMRLPASQAYALCVGLAAGERRWKP